MPLLKSSQLANIIWKGKNVIFIVALVSLILGLAFEKARTPYWRTTVPLVISPEGENNPQEFNYDHYYYFEASDILTDSLEEWLKTPSTKETVQAETKASFRSSGWSFWENNNWSVKKKAPQVIEVSFWTNSSNNAGLTEKALKNKVQEFLSSFNQTGKPYFNLTNSTSELEFGATNWGTVSILSLLWGILIGIILVLEIENLRQKKIKS